jgi:hypothetical protein
MSGRLSGSRAARFTKSSTCRVVFAGAGDSSISFLRAWMNVFLSDDLSSEPPRPPPPLPPEPLRV